MREFDIDEIREEIKEVPYEDKLDFLQDKESELEDIVDELDGYISDISSLIDEVQTEKNDKMCKQVLQSLKDKGYDMELDDSVDFSFKASQKQLTTRELISSILPEFKADGNYFSQNVPEEEICKRVVDVVDKLISHRLEFERITDK